MVSAPLIPLLLWLAFAVAWPSDLVQQLHIDLKADASRWPLDRSAARQLHDNRSESLAVWQFFEFRQFTAATIEAMAPGTEHHPVANGQAQCIGCLAVGLSVLVCSFCGCLAAGDCSLHLRIVVA